MTMTGLAVDCCDADLQNAAETVPPTVPLV